MSTPVDVADGTLPEAEAKDEDERRAGCPKRMVHGPCGGVQPDGACELGDRPCPFVDTELVRWRGQPGNHQAGAQDVDPLLALAATRPLVVVDLPDRSLDPDSVRRAAAALAGVADAAQFGDNGWARVQLPPSYRAALVAREGLRPWAGLNCRDRNRVALEGELAGLAAVGAAVHCVTGDHPGCGHRADAAPVFDLDSMALAAMARATGVLVSVAENPVAPPVELRPGRAAEKARAGAHVCIVNHAGSAERVRWFVEATRAAGAVDLRFLACVPLVTSERGLRLLRTFTGLALPAGFVERIEEARDPFVVGVDEAVGFASAVLEVPGVVGVDLGVVFPPGDEEPALAGALAAAGALRGR